jgi:hypothetical protein
MTEAAAMLAAAAMIARLPMAKRGRRTATGNGSTDPPIPF